MISASLDASPRPSKTSQPKIRTISKYSRRTDTKRDHAPITLIPPNRRSQALYRVLNRYTLQAARAVQQAAETAAALRDAREQAAAAQATARQQAAASLPAETP